MSNLEPPVHRKHAKDGGRRLRRVVPLVTAATISASLVAAAAGPASAAAQQPAGAGDNVVPAASLLAAARYVHVSDGHVTVDTVDAQKAGVGSQALSAESALVSSLNQLLDRGGITGVARNGAAVNVAMAMPAAVQNTTIQVLPGITLTIDGSGIQLNLTKQAVTEVENVVGFGQSVASLVGSILTASGVPLGGQIAGIVAASLGVGNAFLKLCTASDGSATFTVPWLGIPSCSGLSIFA